jgi:glycosyltransferase involved in cell wall biosynthesis
MKVAVLIDSVSRNSGGLYDAVRRLAHSIHDLGEDVRVLAVEDARTAMDTAGWAPAHVEVVPAHGPRRFGYGPQLPRALATFDPDVVMPQGLWMYTSLVSLGWARSTRRPYVIHPHGMLDPWAVRNSGWKKKIAARLFERLHLEGAACIRSLNHAEAKAIRTFGLPNPIAVIPNGVDLPVLDESSGQSGSAGGEPGFETRRRTSERKVLFFLGRIHPKKGLAELIEGWRRSRARYHGWTLEIAGWNDGGNEAVLRNRIAKLNLDDSVTWLGPLFGDAKDTALRRASAFILPSLSEGLPMTVLEAWAYGLPVLKTSQCNLPEGFTAGAAIRIEPKPESIAGGLDRMAALADGELSKMGRLGRRLVAERFTWPQVAADMKAVYDWVLGNRPKPECVVV